MYRTGVNKPRPLDNLRDPILGGSSNLFQSPVELAANKMSANGYRFDGVAGHGAIPDSASQAIGTSDFYIMAVVMLDDWTPSATVPLYSKISGNNGVKFNLTAAGLLQLQIGNGSNFTTYSYSSTAAVPSSDNMVAFVAVVADRDGNAVFYWNGVQLGDPVSISGSSAQSATAAATAYLFRDGSTYTPGRCVWFALGNYAPDATTVLHYYLGGVPDSDKWGSFAVALTPDWSAGADSWAGVRATVAGNIDGISDGTTSKDDNLRVYADNTAASTHFAYRSSVTAHQKRFRIAGSYYIPNSGGSTYLDGIRMVFGGSSSGTTGMISPDLTTVGAWTNFSVDAVNQTTNTAYNQINFVCRKAGSIMFTGANSVTDDLFYLNGLTVTQLGCVVLLDGSCYESCQSGTWYDQTSNSNNATMTSATVLMPRKSQPNRLEYWNSSGAASMDIYETGTWTPAITFTTPGDLAVTYTTQTGHYRRIGDMVFCSFNIVTATFTHTTASGSLTINGLPFTIGSSASFSKFGGSLEFVGGINFGTVASILLVADSSTTRALLRTVSTASPGVTNNITSGNIPTGGTVTIAGSFWFRL